MNDNLRYAIGDIVQLKDISIDSIYDEYRAKAYWHCYYGVRGIVTGFGQSYDYTVKFGGDPYEYFIDDEELL